MPKGWKHQELGENIDLTSGYAFKSSEYSDKDKGVKLLRGDNITPNKLRWKNAKYWDNPIDEKLEKLFLKSGDLIIAMDRTWVSAGLKIAVVKESDLPCLLVQRVARVRANKSLFQDFISHIITGHQFSEYVKSVQTETAVPHISSKQIKEFPVLVPPLPEQKKIAKILATWDEGITTTEQLIEASKKQKKALMHKLLTGKKRSKKFAVSNNKQATRFYDLPVDWDYPQIKDIASAVSQKNISGKQLTVLSCTKHNGLVESLSYFGKQVFSKDTSTYKIVPRNCFAYATNHIEEGSIGYQNQYDEALISPMYTVFKTTSNINDRFLFHLLKTEWYRHIFEVNTNASVDRRGCLRWKEFSLIRIPLPSLPEQEHIAATLDKCDQLIEQYEKKALMQQLLTGKRRVKVDDAQSMAVAS